ncbi:HipA N-terminal domain-containing protein [Xanthomonas sp. PPL139]
MELHYDTDWVGADIGRPLSLSLPFNLQNQPLKGEKVFNYFDNLLPDSDAIRRRVAQRFTVPSTDPFDLLSAGGSAAGLLAARCRRHPGRARAGGARARRDAR